jgi:hypothetical protein
VLCTRLSSKLLRKGLRIIFTITIITISLSPLGLPAEQFACSTSQPVVISETNQTVDSWLELTARPHHSRPLISVLAANLHHKPVVLV